MSRIRTFIAVELSKPIRDRATALQEEMARSGGDVKWTEPENLHITLIFLGEVADREVPEICQIVREGVKGVEPFRLSVESVGCFPNPRRPRVLWVGIGEGTQQLVAIHDNLEAPFFDRGYRMEERKYTPHVTLGRVRSERSTERLAGLLAQHGGWQGGEMTVQEIHIMGSELTRDGPLYTVLGRARL